MSYEVRRTLRADEQSMWNGKRSYSPLESKLLQPASYERSLHSNSNMGA